MLSAIKIITADWPNGIILYTVRLGSVASFRRGKLIPSHTLHSNNFILNALKLSSFKAQFKAELIKTSIELKVSPKNISYFVLRENNHYSPEDRDEVDEQINALPVQMRQ